MQVRNRIAFIFILSLFLLQAQDKKVSYKAFAYTPNPISDSLYAALADANDANTKMQLIDSIAQIHILYGNTDSILYYGKYLNDQSFSLEKEQITNLTFLAKSHLILGLGNMQKGLLDEAIKEFIEGINLIGDNHNTLLHQLQLGLARTYMFRGEFEKSGSLLSEILSSAKDTIVLGKSHIYLADLRFSQNNTEAARSSYTTAKGLLEKTNAQKELLYIDLQRGRLAFYDKDYRTALDLLENTKTEALNDHFYDLYIDAVLEIGNVYTATENYQAANIVLNTAYVNAVQWERLELQKKVIDKIRKVLVLQGDYKNAYNIMTQYLAVSNDIIRNQKSEQIKELEIKYETVKKEKEIFALQQDQRLKEAAIARQKTIKNAILIGFLVLLVPTIALLIVYYQKLQAQSQLNAQQEELNQQKMAALKNEQELHVIKTSIEAQHKERERIAQELHDQIGGNLAAMKLQLNDATEIGSSFKQQLDDTYRQVREISHDLIPKAISDGLFTNLIDNYLANINDNDNGADFKFYPHPKAEINQLSEPIKVEIFSIIKELVTNAIKYAAAKTVNIHLTVYENTLNLLYEDNGKGFNTHEAKMGIGLKNMSNRIAKLKGTMQIDSSENRGTVITLEIPLNTKR